MRYVKPRRLKVLMALFFGTGIWGIYFGLTNTTQVSFMITFLAVINLSLGGFFGWIFLTQSPKLRDKRKE